MEPSRGGSRRAPFVYYLPHGADWPVTIPNQKFNIVACQLSPFPRRGVQGASTVSGLNCVESCLKCHLRSRGFFCDLSPESMEAFNKIKHAAVFPDHAVVLVEGQNPWGIFIL